MVFLFAEDPAHYQVAARGRMNEEQMTLDEKRAFLGEAGLKAKPPENQAAGLGPFAGMVAVALGYVVEQGRPTQAGVRAMNGEFPAQKFVITVE